MDKIIIKGAKEHNLKNINLELPHRKIIVFTGVSGSGKSSLAFDTIFAEGQRRYVESLSPYARQFLSKLDKSDVESIEGLSPAISIDQKSHSHNPRSIVATVTEIYDYLRVLLARIGAPHCPKCKIKISKMTTEEMVNHLKEETEKDKKIKSITILAPVVKGRRGEYYQLLYDLFNDGFAKVKIDGQIYELKEQILLDRKKKHQIDLIVDEIRTSVVQREKFEGLRSRISESLEIALKYGEEVVKVFLDEKEILMSARLSCPKCFYSFSEIEPRTFSFNSPYGACPACHGLGTESFYTEKPCSDCHGKRLKKESLSIYLGKMSIWQIVQMSVKQARLFFTELLENKISPKLSAAQFQIALPLIKEILNRLDYMSKVDLDYLTLERKSYTLSSGESQRIRLASQIGSKLTGALYILDEPTIGLHPYNTDQLIKILGELKEIGNTIIVVEHDERVIKSSDYLLDLGRGAGKDGGEIVAQGFLPQIISDKKQSSLTLEYLRKEKRIETPKWREVRTHSNHFKIPLLKVYGAYEYNLKNIDVTLPLGKFVCLTGVSGSGKSTLVNEVIYKALVNKLNYTNFWQVKCKGLSGEEYLEKVILVDQSPIGRTPRSNPATYVGFWGFVRDLFAATEEARKRGYASSRFSFNVTRQRGGGRCEHCEGNGLIEVEMHFLPTAYVLCDVCQGKRFDRETLEVKYKGKNIYEVLNLTIEEAIKFFGNIPLINDKLKVLGEVGLGYLALGQGAPTLSGGEAQRIKLASELSRRSTGKNLYILDEPTIGLHYDDVKKLIYVLQQLVNRGNTVLVIEHNLDLIKCADWLIDLGPGGGDEGGKVVVAGPPILIANCERSLTGRYLKEKLNNNF